MRIGIDIDDTITNSYNKILEELQKEYGINRFDYINQGITYYDIQQQKHKFPGYDKFCYENFERLVHNLPRGFELWATINSNYLQLKLNNKEHFQFPDFI